MSMYSFTKVKIGHINRNICGRHIKQAFEKFGRILSISFGTMGTEAFIEF